MSIWNDHDEDVLRNEFLAQRPAMREPEQVWRNVAGNLGPQIQGEKITPFRSTIPAVILLIIMVIIAGVVDNAAESGDLRGASPTRTPDAYALAVMRDNVLSGQADVLLSERVQGWQLPCLGVGYRFGSVDNYQLVVLGGKFVPGGNAVVIPSSPAVPYAMFIYDIQQQSVVAYGSPNWPRLRAAFGGPSYSQDSPLYLSPDGQPNMSDALEREPGYVDWYYKGLLAKPLSQTVSGWTITLMSVYAQDDKIVIGYTLSGSDRPRVLGTTRMVVLTDGYPALVDSAFALYQQSSPTSDLLSYSVNNAVVLGDNVKVTIMMSAVHVRPDQEQLSCSDPSLSDLPIPTATSGLPLPGDSWLMPPLDVAVSGPFSFDLEVPVVHLPAKPTPIFTARPFLLTPERTNLAEPIPTPIK